MQTYNVAGIRLKHCIVVCQERFLINFEVILLSKCSIVSKIYRCEIDSNCIEK